MKCVYFVVCFGLLPVLSSLGQTASSNYVLSRTYKQRATSETPNLGIGVSDVDKFSAQITYYDGLGKPTQQIMAFESANKNDVALLTTYDSQFRPQKTYLPTPLSSGGGTRQDANTLINTASGYYNNGNNVTAQTAQPYSSVDYEASPLSRVTSQRAPGAGTSVNTVYGVNVGNTILRYVTTGSSLTSIGWNNAYYAQGELTWQSVEDENGGKVTQYTDRYGRVVLKEVLLDPEKLFTYYVYDERGLLRAVLQPKFQKPGEDQLANNAFLYRYDSQGRLVEKKIPGAKAVQMSYRGDTELLEYMTDGKGQRFYYLYDNLNRQKEMGVCTNPNCDGREALVQTYYDNYGYGPFASFTNSVFNLTDEDHFVPTGSEPAGNELRSGRAGLVTGSAARVLNADGSYGTWVKSVTYYDNKYRPVQLFRQLHGLNGGAYERTSYKLDFNGRVKQEETYQATGSETYKLVKTMEYDHADRLTKTKHEFYEGDMVISKHDYTHVEQTYNEIGQLATKSLHGGVQKQAYRFTPRGWLGKQENTTGKTFRADLTYQDNGNITTQSWQTPDYGGGMNLNYDKASRLKNAIGTGGFSGYNESAIDYDANGNLKYLTRTFNNTTIDQLDYSKYTGNQLNRINDNNRLVVM